MNYSVFYSWQSDLPNKTNRTAIQTCIRRAIKSLSDKPTGCVFTYDESTWDIAGTPDIAQTILQKIDKSDVFICDISIVNNDCTCRKCPNPNVLFELGYATRGLGWDKVICIFNLASGRIEDLPFDINHKRVLAYSSESEKYKDSLAKRIEDAIGLMIRKGLLYNPLKDHLKGKIDYCILAILKQISCIVYGVYTMTDALLKTQELLLLTNDGIKERLSDGHKILGFFAKNDLQETGGKLDDIFSTIISSSVYPEDWALIVLELIDWLRMYQWKISHRSSVRLCTDVKMSMGQFKVVNGRQLNSDNPPNSFLLLERVANGGKVLYSATMAKFDEHSLLTFQSILEDSVLEFAECFYKATAIANNWYSATGEFILDPDFYPLT